MSYTHVSIVPSEAFRDHVTVNADYHPDLVTDMRRLNARFQDKSWVIDKRDEPAAREICKRIFGTTGDDHPTLVDLRIHVQESLFASQAGVFLAGRQVARATGRDSGAKLGPGVVVIRGESPTSGGSMKNWKTVIPGDSVLEIRDVPKPAADKLMEDENEFFTVSVVGQASPGLDELYIRRNRLLEDLREVEGMISGYEEK